ncbi:DUF389 domain-containing protein [Sphingorhabdus sp. SMR4y]|uniref:DUF389 domain-containing protein n=1 Tax=Sphingorhabdus sp. SMR4y TaxID=2584094 RepID=UPI000B5C8E65|nr:DUF389 domain-containing protein [Sphingorhabdus sp. SMR4y]ASK88243.1 TIGR00341 family protein [Sphingorhabdus sp. SMR4y]
MTDNQANAAGPEALKPKSSSGLLDPVTGSIRLFRRWWRMVVRADVEQQAVIDKVREDSGFTPHFAFMTSMSAGIAILGLLLSSPAVVIGAMLLSPLMGPIMGAGFALAVGDSAWLRESGKAIVLGSIISILFAGLVVTLSPLQTVTAEIAARTRPNLFDLLVALFSALAGAYAMIRGRMGTIVGVAIATALMPPLAVVGFGLATFNWAVFGGSLLLFFTNLMTIALTATAMAWLYGFRSYLSERQSQFQIAAMVVVFIALAIPLGLSLRQIAWEANVSRSANGYIKDQFGKRASVSQIEIDFAADPITVNATVFTPTIIAGAAEQSSRVLSRSLGRSITVNVDQFKVETGEDARSAELAAAKTQAQAREAEIQVTRLRENLALIAGVSVDDVTLDSNKRRAVVVAKPLPGATLASYRALEQRVASAAKGWIIRLQPPAIALPVVRIANGAVDPASGDNLDVIIWASERIGLPLGMSGTAPDRAVAREALMARNIVVAEEFDRGISDAGTRFRWLAPTDSAGPAQ